MMVDHFAASDGTEIAFRTFGAGDRVITALHSLSLDGSWYRALADELGDDYRVICPDVRGHGETTEGPTKLTLERVAADVVELWDVLGVESSVVLGVSMGGMVAQAVTARAGSRVEGLVLVATGGAFDEAAREGARRRIAALRAADEMTPYVEPLLERWFGEAAANPDDPLVARGRGTLERTSPHVQADALEAMLEVGTFGPPEEAIPTLVIGGSDDASSTPAVIEALVAKYPGARHAQLPGPHLFAFTDVAAAAAVIVGFLDEHRAQPARA